ncbi:MAG TPA: DoxX family protein [Caulobacteraceae bacterium]|nr:DoxX family protein [Caulobacteraceae bacterium]
MERLNAWAPRVLSLVRIIAALLFLEHGLMKLFHFPAAQPLPPGMTSLPPILIAAAVIELVGGVLLTLGLFTRAAAFICSGEMAVGYFLAHAAMKGPWPAINGGDAAILLCWIFFYLVFAGGGEWSADAMVRRKA